ncbi:ATP-dependent DNA helicase [Trichonephila clavata]|uniref:ATP-dependent DNA helicase n=1 Tax=Trichonephila clavata TaxID=2740835 RepID=A0A8X6KI53_TRICU|nr:ATP-dependent DNA helicase [Trichonephila clavata]
MVFGDLFQLPPIRGAQAFHQPDRFDSSTHLWRLIVLLELTENIRQQGDTTFTDLLNALGVCGLKAPHFALLELRMLTEASGDFDLDRAICMYPTRAQVDAHKTAVLDRYRVTKVRVFKFLSQDVLINATRNADNVITDNIVSGNINKTGGLQKELEIFNGARVMFRSNINIEQGLVNGAMGIITEIV